MKILLTMLLFWSVAAAGQDYILSCRLDTVWAPDSVVIIEEEISNSFEIYESGWVTTDVISDTLFDVIHSFSDTLYHYRDSIASTSQDTIPIIYFYADTQPDTIHFSRIPIYGTDEYIDSLSVLEYDYSIKWAFGYLLNDWGYKFLDDQKRPLEEHIIITDWRHR